jgi:hypothetical protein
VIGKQSCFPSDKLFLDHKIGAKSGRTGHAGWVDNWGRAGWSGRMMHLGVVGPLCTTEGGRKPNSSLRGFGWSTQIQRQGMEDKVTRTVKGTHKYYIKLYTVASAKGSTSHRLAVRVQIGAALPKVMSKTQHFRQQ